MALFRDRLRDVDWLASMIEGRKTWPVIRYAWAACQVFAATWLCAGCLLEGTWIANNSAYALLASCFSVHVDYTTAVALIACCLVSLWSLLPKSKWGVAACICAAVCLIRMFATLISGDPHGVNILEVASLMITTALGLIAATVNSNTQRSAVLVSVLIFVEAIYTIARYFTGLDAFYSGHVLRASGTYDGPDSLCRVLAPAVPLALAMCVRSTRSGDPWFMRALWLLVTLTTTLALVMTFDRGGVIAAAASSAIILIWMRASKQWIVCVVAIGLLSVVFVGTTRVADAVGVRSSQRSISSRFVLWEEAWMDFMRHPLTGVGQGRLILPIQVGQLGAREEIGMLTPQNQGIFFLAEDGLAGTVVVSLLCVAIVMGLMRSRTYEACGLLGAWIALVICGATDDVYGIGGPAFAPVNCLIGMLIGTSLRTIGAQTDCIVAAAECPVSACI